MRIGELAERAGVSVRSLRYYEEQGLLAAQRSPSGQRLYDEDAVARVWFLQNMYQAGLTSENIRELLPCFDRGHTDIAQRVMLHDQRERLHERISQLSTVLARLDEVIAITDQHP